MATIINELAQPQSQQAVLGFTPKEARLGEYENRRRRYVVYLFD